MTRQITVEVWDEDEARAYIYEQLSLAIAALSWLSPHPSLDEVAREVSDEVSMSLDCLLGPFPLEAPVEIYAGVAADIAIADLVLADVIAEISEEFDRLYPTPTTPIPQGF